MLLLGNIRTNEKYCQAKFSKSSGNVICQFQNVWLGMLKKKMILMIMILTEKKETNKQKIDQCFS